jgi:hypothetical protein
MPRHPFSSRQRIPTLPCAHPRCIELADGVRVCAECTAVLPPPDSRPRVLYVLPSGEVVPVIFDHGDAHPFEITYTLEGGKVVTARRLERWVPSHIAADGVVEMVEVR